jgi:hypothetical protein
MIGVPAGSPTGTAAGSTLPVIPGSCRSKIPQHHRSEAAIKRPDRHVAFLNAGQHGSLARTSRTLLPSLAVAFPARGGGIARPARARPGSVDPHGRQRRPDDSGTPGSDRRGGKPIGVVDAEAVSELGRGAPTVAVSAPLRPSTPASSTITRVLSAPPSVTVRRPVAARAASARAARAPSVFRLRLP